MSLPADYYSVSMEARTIEAWLKMWAEPRGGEVSIMASMRHLWETVFKKSVLNGKPEILICYTGEQARGGFNESNTLHRVDRQWTIALLYGHGFNPITAETDGEKPCLMDATEELRDRVRMLLTISLEFPIDYKGTAPIPGVGPDKNANVFLDGSLITFSTANDIPNIVRDNPVEQPVEG